MVVRWSEKLEDRFSAGFATLGFYKGSKHVGSAGVLLDRYLDLDVIFRDPAYSRLAVELFSREVKAWAARERVDYIAFLEKRANTTGAIMLAGAISIDTGIPNLIIRLRKDIPHERIKFPPQAGEYPLKDAHVVLLSDYVTTGSELQPAVSAVRGLGGKVLGVIALVWDDERFNKRGEIDAVGIPEEMVRLVLRASDAERIAQESKEVVESVLGGD